MKKLTALFLTMVMLLSTVGGVVAEEVYEDYNNKRPFNGVYGKIKITLKTAKTYSVDDFSYIPIKMVVQKYPKSLEVYLTEKTEAATDAAVASIKDKIGDNIEYITPEYTTAIVASGMVAGDINEDYLLTLADVTHALKYITGWNVPVFCAGNVNYDSVIDLTDVTMMLKLIAGWDEDHVVLNKLASYRIEMIEADYTRYMTENYRYDPEYGPLYVQCYYGRFNNAAAVLMGGPFDYTQAEVTKEIAGSVFYYSCGHYIEIWKNGEFFSVEEAYEKGILTKEDVKVLSVRFNSDEKIKYETPEYYLPKK